MMTDGELAAASPVVGRPGDAGAGAGTPVTAALPVALDLGPDRSDAVRSWVEGMLGWQVVDGTDADPVPAVLCLRDHRDGPPTADGARAAASPGHLGIGTSPVIVAAPDQGRSRPAEGPREPAGDDTPERATRRTGFGGGAGSIAGVPTVLLLPDGSDPVEAAATALRLEPAAVIGWPSGRDRLPSVATALLEVPRRREGSAARLTVGGSAGGVGTTTVTLALAGLRAWSGTRTLAAVRGLGSPHRGVPAAALGGGDLWAAAERLPGIDALRVVSLLDHAAPPDVTDPSIEAVLLDLGPDPDCDVLVCRPDAAGLAALGVTTAAAIVLVGGGPVPHRALASAAAGRPILRVPWSARVARAGAIGRVPAGLPGTWVAGLRPLLAGLGAHGPAPPATRHAGSRRSRWRPWLLTSGLAVGGP